MAKNKIDPAFGAIFNMRPGSKPSSGGSQSSDKGKFYNDQIDRAGSIANSGRYIPLSKSLVRELTDRHYEDRGAIAPVRQDAGYLKRSSLFDDGWDFGDVFRTILGTGADAGENLLAGGLATGESFLDSSVYLGTPYQNQKLLLQTMEEAAYNGLFGKKTTKEDLEKIINRGEADKKRASEFIAKDLYDPEKIAHNILAPANRFFYIDPEGHSVFGEKMDATVQSGGQLLTTKALQALGIPADLVMGLTSFGSEAENAFRNGATYEEAGASAAVTAASEVLTEKISGGIKFGGKTLDDALTSKIGRLISNKAVRNLAKLGIDLAGEGGEEVLSGAMSAIGQKLTYADDQELSALFSSEDALDSFIGGVLMSSVPSTFHMAKSHFKGVDYATGNTKNEQTVIDQIYKERVKEAQKKAGKDISGKEKGKIYDAVVRDMERGYLSTDDIERILGGDAYRSYKDTVDSEDAIISELEKLGKMQNATLAQQARYNDLSRQVKDIQEKSQRSDLKTKLGRQVSEMVKSDRLAESYNERGRRGKAFEADLSRYDAKQRATVQKAIDSGILNNTNRSHELVDMVAKIAGDKGLSFDFANNARLKESGFAIEGKTVNGFVNKDGVTLNIESAKSLNSVVGHEITHVLEGTDFYGEMRTALFDYAKSKNDFDSRRAALSALYKGMEADIDAELTADLVGDYLFSDQDFVNHLAAGNRNVFQKVYDEVKYLCKAAAAGSKEARKLEQVKRVFEEVYKGEAKVPTETKYSIVENFTDSNGGVHDNAVLLDTEFFNGISPYNWGKKLEGYVNARAKNNPFIMPIADENGNMQMLEFARPSDRLISESGNNRKVLTELSRTNDNISKLSVIHIDEIVEISEKKEPYHTGSTKKQWIDQNGWLHRTAEVINSKNGAIYELTFDIAKAADGRHILYATKGNIKRIGDADVNSLAQSVRGTEQNSYSPSKVTQTDPDVNTQHSLSSPDKPIAPVGRWNIRGEDVALKSPEARTDRFAAPIGENAKIRRASPVAGPVRPDIAPPPKKTPGVQIREARQTLDALRQESEALHKDATYDEAWQARYKDIESRQQAAQQAYDKLISDAKESGVLRQDAFSDGRDMKTVGSQKVKAYQYENPEVKPFFQDAAYGMLDDLHNTTKGERWYHDQLYYDTGGEAGFGGTKRQTAADIAELLDTYHYTYDQIEKGINAIIEDNGAENNAVSKRIEFMLNDRLMNGYTTVTGEQIQPSEDYARFMEEKQISEYSEEAFKSYLASMPAQKINPLLESDFEQQSFLEKDIAPIRSDIRRKPPILDEAKVAKVLDTEPKTEQQRKNRAAAIFAASVFDKGIVFENLSLKTHNRELMGKWNYTLSSEARAQRLIGNGADGVKSLYTMMEEVSKTGKTKLFSEYMYHMHNVDRMSLAERYESVENKAVFGDSVDAVKSSETARRLEQANPEFRAMARDVYAYNEHLRKLLVDGGVISQETADLWAEMYPHYVPVRRAGDHGLNINVPLDTNKTGVNTPVRKATGGNSDILPLFDTMAQRTIQTYKAIAKNSFGIELKNTLGSTVASEASTVDGVIDSIDTQEGLLKEGVGGKNPTFTVFENGQRVTFEISKDMYDALKPVSEGLAYRNKYLRAASSFHRGLLTEYNPTFMVTNAIKDIQDVLVNSQHTAKTYAKVPEAWKQILGKGYYYNEYMEAGGEENTYFNKQDISFDTAQKGLAKMLDYPPFSTISKINNFIEMTPRLAEYIASRESGRSVEVSMLDAARVTTNFAAGGDVTKFLNGNGCTFLNASVQGAMQQVRNVREAKANGWKGWVGLCAKFAVAGLPSILLNNLVWDDDEDYADLSDYVKENYYVIYKTNDGQFIRIPKGRTLAVIQNAVEQIQNAATGDDDVDMKRFLELAVSNLAPNNPMENNIIAPIVQVKNNETWYGEELVPSRLQDLPTKEQFDESTDSFSKWLGEKLNVSPVKINYLLNQYTGGVGDVALPMMTPKAEYGEDSFLGNLIAPMRDKFTTDVTFNDKNVSDFYSIRDQLEVRSNSREATTEDKLRYAYADAVGWDMADLYKQKREVQNSSIPDKEKFAQVKKIQSQINEMAKNALGKYQNVSIRGKYAEAGDKRYNYDAEKDKWYEITTDNWYGQKEQEVTKGLGISYAEYWNNREEYNFAYDKPGEYALAKATGGFESYQKHNDCLFDYRSDSYIPADKDKNGKSISGSRKPKVRAYVDGLNIPDIEKEILYKSVYHSYHKYDYEIIDYLNSRKDLSYKETEQALTALGFKVDREGNISW